jgi:hypothetical protein
MFRQVFIIAIACMLCGTGLAPAQEKFTVKLKERGEGESAVVKKKDLTVTIVRVADANGNELFKSNETKEQNTEYTETILKREAGKPTKWQRVYATDASTKDKDSKNGPLHGLTVIIEKKDGKFEFMNKAGDKLTDEAEKALAVHFSKKGEEEAEIEKMVLPTDPVMVGDSWKIDVSKIAKLLSKEGLELDAAKSTGKGTLVKAYKKDGRQFGVMKFNMTLPLISAGKGKEMLKFNPGANILLNIDFDACIDGASENGTMKTKMFMKGNANVPNAMVTLDVVADGTQVHVDAPKK